MEAKKKWGGRTEFTDLYELEFIEAMVINRKSRLISIYVNLMRWRLKLGTGRCWHKQKRVEIAERRKIRVLDRHNSSVIPGVQKSIGDRKERHRESWR